MRDVTVYRRDRRLLDSFPIWWVCM